MTDIGIIIIGRNEGERLRRCLASVLGRQIAVVYVDSASTDGSTTVAQSMGAEVVELDMSRPFAASRARNAGFERLLQIAPGVGYVQFVDGDCEMVAGWFDAACKTLDWNAEAAVVCGRVRERSPEASIYNRLADIEWNTPTGEVKSCGGIAMMRVAAFQQAGGFDPSVVAGEEPELCQRLRGQGWKILRIDAEMALHDSAMFRLGQWWKRAIRNGYGAMDIATRFGSQGLFVRQVRSARAWAARWMWAAIASFVVTCLIGVATVTNLLGWRNGFSHALTTALILTAAVFLLLPTQMLRTAWAMRSRAQSWRDAAAYGFLTIIGKWANYGGQRQYIRDRAVGREARLIEYKSAAVGGAIRKAVQS